MASPHHFALAMADDSVGGASLAGGSSEPSKTTEAMNEGLEDLQPTPATPESRTWGWRIFALAWGSMIVNPGSISSGAAILGLGLSVPEAVSAQALAALIMIVALVLNGWAGTKYGIPFPVFARSSFGGGGAHFCTLTRGAVAIMWLSFQMWQGVLGFHVALQVALGQERVVGWGRISADLDAVQLLLLLGFLTLHAVCVHLGPSRFKSMVKLVMPALVLSLIGVLIWVGTLSSFPEAMQAAEEEASPTFQSSTFVAWMAAVNSSISMWSTLVLNVCDLSRFSPRQKDQALGQAIGFPIPFVVTGFAGMWVAGATSAAYGVAYWQVAQWFYHWPPAVAVLGSIVLGSSILVVNVIANMLSPINDLMNVAPHHFSFRGCGYVVLILSVCVCPWSTFSNRNSFVLSFLSGYGMVTGAIAGVFLADFWLLRRAQLDVEALYTDLKSVNWRALVAVAAGVGPCLPGFVDSLAAANGSISGPGLRDLYAAGSWVVALILSGTVYSLLMLTAATSKSSSQDEDSSGSQISSEED